MFTGIVDALGSIDAVHVNNGVELRVKASYKDVKKGEHRRQWRLPHRREGSQRRLYGARRADDARPHVDR